MRGSAKAGGIRRGAIERRAGLASSRQKIRDLAGLEAAACGYRYAPIMGLARDVHSGADRVRDSHGQLSVVPARGESQHSSREEESRRFVDPDAAKMLQALA